MKQKSVWSGIVIGVLILQVVAGAVIFIFLYNMITDPNSTLNSYISQNIKGYVAGITIPAGLKGDPGDTIQGPKGDKGDSIQGPQGNTGSDGHDGQSIVGPQGPAGADGQSIQGPKGDTGERGPAGERPEFRCNPDTAMNEYKYPSDEDWSEMGSICIPGGTR